MQQSVIPGYLQASTNSTLSFPEVREMIFRHLDLMTGFLDGEQMGLVLLESML